MSTNLSKKRREKLLEALKIMKEQYKDDLNMLNTIIDIENALTEKKYGLVFEEHEENVDVQLKTKIPVFIEDKSKEIKTDGINKINFLLEGDNLHSLKLLEKTHKKSIDIIYIDPPYNRGKNDFVYDDCFVGVDDGYKHSKWLSFMEKRLKIARNLLCKKGVIFISIDDREQANLKLLCDEIFNSDNFIGCIPRRTKSSGKTTNKISQNHDYILIYGKLESETNIIQLEHIDPGFKYEDQYVNERGKYKLNQTLDYDSLSYSNSLDYQIEIEGEIFYPGSSYEKYMERKDGKHNRADWAWRWSKDLFDFGYKNGFIVIKRKRNGESRIYTKTYLNAKIEKEGKGYKIVNLSRKKPISTLDFMESTYSNDNAKKDLNKVFGQAVFDYPKPVELIKKLIQIYGNKAATVLDFFAGSGTTGQAVMEINKEDEGKRTFILCTNNQNNICEDITYKRLSNIIKGYKNKSEIEGVGGNLKYYKTEYIDRFISDEYSDIREGLKKYIEPLIQLENGIDINSPNIIFVLSDEDANSKINKENLKNADKLYIACDVLTTGEQEDLIIKSKVTRIEIPEYYFSRELWESAIDG